MIGPSGGGKSTILSLIDAFHYPSYGRILIDGKDLSTLDPIAYRRMVGYLTQDPILFRTSIFENITYGTIAADESQVYRATHKAGLLSYVDTLPLGLDTEVGVRGDRLSTGQKQCVAVARLILRSPSIVLLDEPTSSLDVKKEQELKGHEEEIMEGLNLNPNPHWKAL